MTVNRTSKKAQTGRMTSGPQRGGPSYGLEDIVTDPTLLPTPCAQQSGNTPENHLAKKPGRRQVTDLAILVENGLLETGGELPALPTPTSRDHKGRNQRDDETCLTGALLPTPAASDGDGGKTSRSGDRKDEPLLGNIAALLPTPVATDANSSARHSTETGVMHSGTSLTDALRLLPTPTSNDFKGGDPQKMSWENATKSRGEGGASSLADVAPLLPTPNAADGDRGKGPRSEEKLAQTRDGDNRLDRQKGLPDLPRLLPTPAAADSDRRQDYARADRDGSGGDDLVTAAVRATNTQAWGKYAPAIRRWELVTRSAPPPTEPNTKGNPRLSPAFSEWLMGWELGWVTEKGLIGRNDQLRIIGNGVVPQQAAAALIALLNVIANTA